MPNTRDTLYRRMTRTVRTEAAREGGGRPQEGSKAALLERAGSGVREAADYSIDKTVTQVVEDIGPARQIISRMPNKTQRRLRKAAEAVDQGLILLSRIIFTIYDLRPWRDKTVQEIEYEAEQKRRDKMRRILRRESAIFAKRASNAYHRMGLSHTPAIHRRSLINGVKKVRFSNIVAERNAIWLQIDTERLPYGVDILKLVDDTNVLTNVSSSLRHHIEGLYDVERGAWLCIERGRGVRGIPQLVTYRKMMDLKDKKAHGLTIPLGETVNSKRLYRNIRDFPHLLVGGATGRGKTSYLNVILAAIIENNTPADVKILLVDLKGGIEFDMYHGIPHLWKIGGTKTIEGVEITDEDKIAPDGIVGRSDKVIKLLKHLKAEGERRLNMFKGAKVTNIDEYNNKRRKSKLDRIVVVFDEWARVALSPEGKKADILLSEITATYRAVGFHVILATQTPITRVISTLIKTNFNARLAFGVPDNTASIVILDNGKAKGLSPVGRSIFKYGIMEIETQVPLITRHEILAIIKEAKEDGGAVEDEFNMLEVFRYSLQNLNGSLAMDKIYDQFKHLIAHNDMVYKLKGHDGKPCEVDGVVYKVVGPGKGNAARRLTPARQADKEPMADLSVPPPVPAIEL